MNFNKAEIKMKKHGVILLTLMTIIPYATTAQTTTGLNILASKIEQTMVDMDVPGVAVIIVNEEKIVWSKTFGVADRKSGRPVDEQTIFRIGSITKMFTGLAMLMAEEDGLLRLDDNVSSVMPDFPYKNQWETTHPLKLVHFLEHTSGLPGLTPEEFNLDRPLSLKEAIKWKAENRQALWPPGMHRTYSNAGPGYAAYLLEHVSGKNYETFVEEKIFKPLAMDSASFFPEERILRYLATGYDTDGYKVIPYWHMIYRAFGAINVRPLEMAPFIQLLLNRGEVFGNRLVSVKSIERMETPLTTLAARSGLKFGYGICNYTYLRKGNLFHGHGGDGDGYLARLGYSRDFSAGYFLVINAYNNRALLKMRHLIEDHIIGDRRPPEPPVHKLSLKILNKYSGNYEKITERFQWREPAPGKNRIQIKLIDNKLFMEKKDKISELIPVSDIHFRYKGETVATSAFVYDENHQLYFQDENTNYKKITDK